MKIATLVLTFTLATLEISAAAEKRRAAEPAPVQQCNPAISVKPSVERVVNGVRFAVFQTDLQGHPTPDRAWLLVTNLHAQPVTVTGAVSHSFVATYATGSKREAAMFYIHAEPFAHVLGAGEKVMLWFCDGTKAIGTKLNLDGGRTVRIASVRNVQVTGLADLEVK